MRQKTSICIQMTMIVESTLGSRARPLLRSKGRTWYIFSTNWSFLSLNTICLFKWPLIILPHGWWKEYLYVAAMRIHFPKFLFSYYFIPEGSIDLLPQLFLPTIPCINLSKYRVEYLLILNTNVIIWIKKKGNLLEQIMLCIRVVCVSILKVL